MMKKQQSVVFAALLAAVAVPVLAADDNNASAPHSRCGVDRVCLTPAAEAAIKDQLAYTSTQRNLERTLSLATLRANIEKQRAERVSAQKKAAHSIMPAPTPAPAPAKAPETTDKQVNTDFPAFGGGPNSAFPFPGNAANSSKVSIPPFQVAGTSDGKAVVLVYGDQRVVSVGDKLPMGRVSEIGFNEVVLGNGEGDTRRYSVSW